MSGDNSRRIAYSRLVAATAAAITMLGGGLVLCGWAFDIALLKGITSDFATMKPNTALSFMLCGASLWLQVGMSDTGEPRSRRWLAIGLALLAVLLGLGSSVEYLFRIDLGIDTILFAESVRAETGDFPGRMAAATAMNMVLIGSALSMLDQRPRRWPYLSTEMLILPALFVAVLAIIGYVYGVLSLYRISAFSTMAAHTALLFVFMGAGTLAARPLRGLAALVTASHGGGLTARLLLPLAITTPVLVGWLCWQGEQAGWYDPAFGWAIFTTVLMVMFTSLVIFVAQRLDRINAERRRAARLIEIQNLALESIVLGAPLVRTLENLLIELERLEPDMLTSILLANEESTRLCHGAAPRLPAAYVAAIDGAAIGPAVGSCGTAAWRREQVVVTDIAADPLWENYREIAAASGLCACWSTPIIGTGGSLLGTFAIYYRTPKYPEPRHYHIIEVVTHSVAIAIDRARAVQALIQREADLEAAQERGNIGSWHFEFGATRGRWSKQMYRIFERDPALPAPTPEEFLELVHPEDRETIAQTFSPNGWQQQELRRLDFRLAPPRAGLRYLSSTVELLRNSDGQPVAMAGTVLDITERKMAELGTQQSLSRLRELSRRLTEVEEDERRSISREVHDRIGADLAAVKLNLSLIGATLPADMPDAVERRLTDTQSLVQSAIDHTRNILAELRPPGLDDYGLQAALEMYAEIIEQRLDISVSVSGSPLEPPLPHVVETALYRIVQEALNNIAKHAQPHAVDITLEQDATAVLLVVADDGLGFDAQTAAGGGYGFRIMRERAEAIGANLTIDSTPRQGTQIVIRVERKS